jgi:hypothetical protein
MFKRTTAINRIKAMKSRIRVIQGGTSALYPLLSNR